MTLFQLSDAAVARFAALSEHGMGFQFALSELNQTTLVIGGRVLYFADGKEDKATRNYLQAKWLSSSCEDEERSDRFEHWINDLPSATDPEPLDSSSRVDDPSDFAKWQKVRAFAMRLMIPVGPFGPVPVFGPPYGHLPFQSRTEPNDVFYRYEPFPKSRRIDPKTKAISAGTFAVPASETPFLTTGFSIVARCALPSLLPATFCWAIQPKGGDQFMCGAGVPAYGQSGGGVEVNFHKGATNRCDFAHPIALPPL